MKNILAISGSIRSASTSERILRFIAEHYHEQLAVELYRDLALLPYFNPDRETPPVVTNLLSKIEQADGVLICSPEYVFSLPGVLKNALEWTVATTVLSDKPTALMIAATSGEHAHDSLTLILKTLGASIREEARLLIKGAKSKLNDQGDVIDEETRRNIHTLIQSLI